jgi:CsoR family transcriptional regulator, copper-sensing transcriptional repressor
MSDTSPLPAPVPAPEPVPSTETCAAHEAAPGYTGDKEAHLRRLKRIEGQVRGLQRMIAEDTYCIDVLTQVSAVTSALRSLTTEIVDTHVEHCVRRAAASGDDAEIARSMAEIQQVVARLVKS